MMRICIQCSASFDVTSDDLDFYKEMGLPEPVWCPACRSQLRCLHRNERSFYRRKCDRCKKDIVAMYSADAIFPVYCQSCFFSDQWDPLQYRKEYDFSRPFLEQYGELLTKVPHLAIINKQSENSEYCNYAYANKNCYLTSGSHQEEDCLYEAYSTKNKDSMDFLWVYGSELIYECLFCKNCYSSLFLDHCEDCSECLFSRDLKGCKNCLFCANLRQKEFYLFDEPCTKEAYGKKMKALQLDTFPGLEQAKKTFFGELPKKFPVRSLTQVNCEDCTGDTQSNSKHLRSCFFCDGCEDCAYGCQMDQTVSSMDVDYMGYDRSERCYQTIGCQGLFNCVACNACWHNSELSYCQFCFSCSSCFGCVSLQQKKYCILNKECTKEEYERVISEVIERMRQEGSYGTFLPASLSPFCYNETMAQDWFPLSAKEAKEKGYRWKQEWDIPIAAKVVRADLLPDSIDDIPDDILNWAIQCEITGKPFRIQKRELEFYRSLRLPIPHLHPEERHHRRIARRHLRILWKRTCGKCSKEIQTTYSPEHPEMVYCERCYLESVY